MMRMRMYECEWDMERDIRDYEHSFERSDNGRFPILHKHWTAFTDTHVITAWRHIRKYR